MLLCPVITNRLIKNLPGVKIKVDQNLITRYALKLRARFIQPEKDSDVVPSSIVQLEIGLFYKLGHHKFFKFLL